MDINFEYYKAFYYVGKYKNITKAAAAMGSNQPNVTRIMKLLESELKCNLLIRGARGVSLTEEGERLYSHVEIAFEQLQSAQEEIYAQAVDGAGTVTVGATETALHLFLLDVLQDFKEKYPKARIIIHNHTTPDTVRALTSGRLDFALLNTPFELPEPMTYKDLISFQDILIGGEQYQHLSHQKQNLKDLADIPWIGLGNGTATNELYKNFFLAQDTKIEPDMEVATSDLLVPLIQNNLGIGFVPERMAEPFLKEKKVFQIPLTCRTPTRKICLVYDKGRGRSAIADELRRYLVDIRH